MPMPHIPSSVELGWGGSMQKAASISGWGRNGDTMVAHVAPGETIIPPEVLEANPGLSQIISQAMQNVGADPNRYVVGMPQMSLNPNTGQPEFFLSGLKKAFKKIAGSTIGKIALTALGAAVGAPYLGAALAGGLTSAAVTKIGGGSWGQAIGAGIGTYAGSAIGGNLFGQSAVGSMGPQIPTAGLLGSGGQVFGSTTVGNLLGSSGLSSIAGALPSLVSSAPLAGIVGSYLGSSFGSSIGASFDPPKSLLGSNIAGPSYDSLSLPSSTGTGVALPNATTAQAQTTSTPTGSGVNPNMPGVSYLTGVKDRNTGATTYQTVDNSTFGNNFGRRNAWGSGVVFA